MTYDIYIGEAELMSGVEYDELYAYWRVNEHSENDAPVFAGDDMTGNSNNRHPGYSQWSNFCDEVGLRDLFFNDSSGLMRGHPGCVLLTKKHLQAFEEALKERAKANPHPPGLSDEHSKSPKDYNKVRLIWLIWWTKWALKNCKYPAIYNC